AAHLTKVYGPMLAQTLGLDAAGMARLARHQVEPLFTKPFGEVSVATFINGGAAEVGGTPHHTTWCERRRFAAQMLRQQGLGSTFDRAQFLLGKQLIYFERYGRMFLA